MDNRDAPGGIAVGKSFTLYKLTEHWNPSPEMRLAAPYQMTVLTHRGSVARRVAPALAPQ